MGAESGSVFEVALLSAPSYNIGLLIGRPIRLQYLPSLLRRGTMRFLGA
jgi:hypothetical protein